MSNQDILQNALSEALETIEPQVGIWTINGFIGSEVNAARVKLKNGKYALVRLLIDSDDDVIEDECANLFALPELKITNS